MASLFTAYLDECGTHDDSDAVVVAGYVSNVTKWTVFSEKWQEALTEAHLDYFHMSDFESYKGQFASWTPEEHKSRLNGFLKIIHDHVILSFGVIVLKKQFDTILSEGAKRLCGDAYGLASIACFTNLAKILREPKNDGWMDITMEAGAKGHGALHWIFTEGSKDPEWRENNRILALAFRDKRRFLPLQAADILAYELYKHVPAQFQQGKRPVRYPLQTLSTTKHEWHYIEEAELKRNNEYLTELLVRQGLV